MSSEGLLSRCSSIPFYTVLNNSFVCHVTFVKADQNFCLQCNITSPRFQKFVSSKPNYFVKKKISNLSTGSVMYVSYTLSWFWQVWLYSILQLYQNFVLWPLSTLDSILQLYQNFVMWPLSNLHFWSYFKFCDSISFVQAKKQSTEGLAFLMFFLAVLGNLAYGLQILVHSVEKEFLLEKTPWLVGSLGVIGLDCTVSFLYLYTWNFIA